MGERAEISYSAARASQHYYVEALQLQGLPWSAAMTYEGAPVRIKGFPRDAKGLDLAQVASGVGRIARQVAARPRGLLLGGGRLQQD